MFQQENGKRKRTREEEKNAYIQKRTQWFLSLLFLALSTLVIFAVKLVAVTIASESDRIMCTFMFVDIFKHVEC